jgi:hypothetical protein
VKQFEETGSGNLHLKEKAVKVQEKSNPSEKNEFL